MLKLNLIGLILFLGLQSYGIDYYWVGGSGDWTDINHWATTSGGSLTQIQTPTPNDNVFFDANSGTSNTIINMNLPVVLCKTLDLSGLNKTCIFSGICSEVRLFGGLKLSNKATWSIPAKFSFESQQTTNVITSNSCQMPYDIFFISVSGGWSLTDSLITKHNIIHKAGSFNTGGNTMRCNQYLSKSSYARTLTLGNSIIQAAKIEISGQGFNVNAGTSEIYLEGNVFDLQNCGNQSFYDLHFEHHSGNINNTPGSLAFHDVWLKKDGFVGTNCTYNILYLTKGMSYSFGGNTQQTFLTDLVANGDCSHTISIGSKSMSASFSKNSGSIDINYIILQNIAAMGGATFNAWSSYDYGGNPGWNISTPAARSLYWVGNTGQWTDSTHWALSSGGPGGECVPTIIDDVVFDNNSFTAYYDTVNIIDSAGNCHDMTWNTTKNPILRGDEFKLLRISGSLHFCTLMLDSFYGNIIFVSKDLGEVVQTANHNLLGNVTFDGLGSWTMLDSLKVMPSLNFSMGKFYSNNQYISCNFFSASTKRWKELYLSTSRIDVWKGSVGVRQDSTFVDPGTSHFHLYSDTTLFKTTHSPQRRFWTVIFEEDGKKKYSNFHPEDTKFHKIIYRGNINKIGHLTVDSIFYSAGYDYVFDGRDTIKDYLHAHGYCTKKITFRSANPMSKSFIYKNSGALNVYRVHMRGIEAVGGANFMAVNSSDLGKNVKWTFQNIGTDLFWVDDGGDWNDSLHWSFSSGGIGGACIPTINDNVYFDQNSFASSGNIVLAESPSIFCKTMTWNSTLPSPTFKTKKSNLFIAGDMNLSSTMFYDYHGVVYFCDTTSHKHILSAGQDFDSLVCFIDTGVWNLSDKMEVLQTLMLLEGHVITNGDTLIMQDFTAYNPYQKILDITNSTIIMNGLEQQSTWYWTQNNKSAFIATNSQVYFLNTKDKLHLSGTGNVDFNNVFFNNPQSNTQFTATNGVVNYNNKVVFTCSGHIYGDHSYDTLILSSNKMYQLAIGKHQNIYKLLQANGKCGQYITITGNGGPSYINKNQGVVEVHEVIMKDIIAQGNAIFDAYGGIDNGGNLNWNFHPNPPRTLFWVEGNGNWDDTAHWSLQSGGPGGECIPTYIDDVFIDSNSTKTKTFTYITIPYSGECHNLWWKHFTNVNFNGALDLYGGMNFIPHVNLSNLSINFMANTNSNLIKTGNNPFVNAIFIGSGGWKLYDSLLIFDSIIFSSGFLNTYGNYVSAKSFNSQNNAKKRLDLGNSTLSFKLYWLMNSDSLSLNAGTSTILFEKGLNYKFKSIGKRSSSYYNVSILDVRKGHSTFKNRDSATVFFNKVKVYNDGDFLNNFIFDSLIFAAGNTYRLQEGRKQIINKYWSIRGNNCYAINLQSTIMYNTAYVFKPSGVVEGDFINMRDIHAQGNNIFYAGKFSTDIDNNQNWIFQNGPNYVYGLGADTSFVLGQNTIINTTNFNGTPSTLYNWSTGSTHDTIVVSKTGWYYVTVTYAGNCIVYDSIYVGCNLELNYDITDAHCHGDTNGIIQIIIPDTNYYYSFLWSTGDTTEIIQPYPAGNYFLNVEADSGRCHLLDTITINEPPIITIPQGDTAFCIGDSVLLDVGNFSKYYWADNYSQQIRWVNKPDTFFVIVENSNACKSFGDTIVVREDSLPFVFLGSDTIICINSSIILSPGDSFTSYLWWDQSNMAKSEIFEPGTYWVMVQQKTCYVYDTIIIDNCPPKLHFPNVFTPNQDGFNDYFIPEEQNILDFDLKIYNRWGMRIFHTTDLKHGWDGSYINQPAADGVYFYVVDYREWEGSQGGDLLQQKGTITLIRNR